MASSNQPAARSTRGESACKRTTGYAHNAAAIPHSCRASSAAYSGWGAVWNIDCQINRPRSCRISRPDLQISLAITRVGPFTGSSFLLASGRTYRRDAPW